VATAAAWAAVVGTAAVWRHEQFLSHRYDLGNMVQAVWSTAHGRPLEMTDAADGEQITRLGAHVDPILVLFAPLAWVFPTAEMLLVVQAGALASGLYPAVRLALEHGGSRLVAALVGCWYLAFPWIVWNAFDDFHPVTLAIPLLLYGVWFLDNERLALFAIAAGLAVLCGELIGLTVAGLGLWYALAHRRYAAGGVIAVAGGGWTALCVAVIVPAFNEGEPSRYYDRFGAVGGTPGGVLETFVTDPEVIVAELTQSGDLRYVLWVLAPTAYLALLAPLVLVAVVPQLGVNLVAEWSTAALPMFHYAAAIVPVIVAATIMALARFPARFRAAAAGAALAASVLVLSAHPPRPGAQAFIFAETYSAARRAALADALELVPDRVPVAATNRLGAHLSERRVIQLFPELEGADWAVVDTRNPWLPGAGEEARWQDFAREIQRLARDPAWRLRFDRRGVRAYERVSTR
jgi:uncharacterized membrane protein